MKRLMDEEMTTFCVTVVGDQKTGRDGCESCFSGRGTFGSRIVGVGVKSFEELNRFGSGSGTHVENVVVRFNVEKEGRNHRHGFLTRDVANVGFVNKEVLETLESFILANGRFGNVELPGEALGVPSDEKSTSAIRRKLVAKQLTKGCSWELREVDLRTRCQ